MNAPDLRHLTTDELDALLDGAGSARVTSHLETCTNCLAMVELDRRLVGALSALPALDPTPGFADRVMAKVTITPSLSPVTVLAPTPRSIAARRRALVGSLVAGSSLVAWFGWAIANPDAALNTVTPVLRQTGDGLWAAMQNLVSGAAGQSWSADLIGAFGSPGKMLLALVAISGIYVVALTGFRRLLTDPVTDARW